MRIICLPDAGFRIELSSAAIVPARAARSNGRLGAAAARDCPRVLPFAICVRAHGAAMRSAMPLSRRSLFPRTSRKAVAIAAFDWMCMAPQRF
jgi:hypothetical protein